MMSQATDTLAGAHLAITPPGRLTFQPETGEMSRCRRDEPMPRGQPRVSPAPPRSPRDAPGTFWHISPIILVEHGWKGSVHTELE